MCLPFKNTEWPQEFCDAASDNVTLRGQGLHNKVVSAVQIPPDSGTFAVLARQYGQTRMGTELIRRFRNGDREAFNTLYRLHHPSVFRFAMHMTGDRPRAEETVQDVFVWLIHNPGKFDPERGELGAFLLGVTRRLLLKRYEAERRFVAFDATFDRAAPEPPDASDTEELKRAILALPPRYREIVVLCDLEEKSYEETAALLDCALGTVRSRLHRARALLERKLRVGEGCAV